MAYSFMSISKVKTMGSMVSKYNHNLRKVDVSNAVSEKAHLNEDLVPLPRKEDGTEMRYDEAFKDRMSSLSYYQEHRVRGDQVLGYEILLTYSRDESVDVDKWKEQSMDWLHRTFDVAGDGKSNVVSAVFHADETGNVHIHAFVVPVDERGHLNAARFTNGSRAMTELQSSYAESVADLGLERGVAGSSASHKTIRKMYADMNRAATLPNPKEGETAEEYRVRIQEDAETMYLTRHKAAGDYERESRRRADRYRNQAREDAAASKAEVDVYRAQIETLSNQLLEIKSEIIVRDEAAKYGEIRFGIEVIREDEPERAAHLESEIDEAISRAEERKALETEEMERSNAIPEESL